MVRIRRFGIVKTATVAAAMYAFIILVMTLLFGIPVALLAGAAGRDSGMAAGIVGAGVVGVLLFGLIGAVAYGLVGWVMTAIACAIYNLVAGWFGGIEVQLENAAPPTGPAWGGPYGGYGAGPGYAQPPAYPPSTGQGGPGQTPPPGWG